MIESFVLSSSAWNQVVQAHFEAHMLSEDHQWVERKTSIDHVKGMFVEKMKSLSDVRSSNSSTVVTLSIDSLCAVMEMLQKGGWAIPFRSNFRFTFEQKDILYKLFMDGEKSKDKISPDGAVKVIRNQLPVILYLTQQQIRGLFSRWSKQLRQNTLVPPVRKTNDVQADESSSEDEEEDEEEEEEEEEISHGDDPDTVDI